MAPPRKIHVLAQEDFDRLLAWLDEDRERAGLVYEKIRWRLITILAARGCAHPAELADETFDRVARRVSDIAATYSGDKTLYFFGVANNVHHEFLKQPVLPDSILPPIEALDDKEQKHYCLELCLKSLGDDAKELIMRYYAEDKQAKIDFRKQTAAEFGISINTLRLRALRIREKLQACIEKCLDQGAVLK